MRVLLGFDTLVTHNRDAMWQPDLAIGLTAVLASVHTTIDRLAEELLLWSTHEFGFVELSDAHCRTSVIMPQKKNPYALAHLRGRARAMTGRLVTAISTNQTPSGQVDNRTAAYELIPLSLRETGQSLDLLREVLLGARFDTERLADEARSGGVWATELVEFLVETECLDARTAHSLVGKMVAEAGDTGDLDALAAVFADVFARSLGRAWEGDAATFASILDPRRIATSRRGVGSCGPAATRAMIEAIRVSTTVRRAAVARRREACDFRRVLLRRVRQILNENG
jgi:argininosuccinate lyase